MAVFTTITKNALSWPAPEPTSVTSDYFLEIGSNYFLSIGGGFRLIIQPGRAGTTWSNINKTR